MKPLYDKLDKETKKRHFSHKLWGGKGDCRRKFTKESEDAYRTNYDRIFSKKRLTQ